MLQRGFTLIELLVVIAIIGILAAVVLGSLNDARDNANDASAQTSINNARNIAEVFYSENSFSYGTVDQVVAFATNPSFATTGDSVCNATSTANLMEAAMAQTRQGTACYANDSAYAITVGLRGGDAYCIDSTGFAGTVSTTTVIDATDVECN